MKPPERLDRRTFLRRSASGAAGLGLFSIVPAFGQDGTPKPSNMVTMGCIGMGGMGNGNMGSFMRLPDVKVVAVCDVDRNHAAAAKKKVDEKYKTTDCASYTDFRELLARDDIDTVCISTPDHWHAIPAILAARSGKDVYGEKPFSHTLVEGRAMVTALTEYGRIWQNGSWQRSVDNFRHAAELVRNGRIGKVVKIEIGLPSGKASGPVKFEDPPPELDYELWLGPGRWAPYCKDRCHYNFRYQYNYGGGKLMDWVPHHGDIAHWAMDWDESGPESITGTADWPEGGIFDAPLNYDLTLRYAGGVEMLISNKIRMGCKWTGEDGRWIYVTRGATDASPKSLLEERIGPDEAQLYKSTSHHRNFIDCVKTRQPTVTPAETAHRSACIGHLGNIAMRLGRTIRWDPVHEKILNDPGAESLLGHPLRSPWHL